LPDHGQFPRAVERVQDRDVELDQGEIPPEVRSLDRSSGPGVG
jgi:hypothetical protein